MTHTPENDSAPVAPVSKPPKFVRWAVMLGIVVALNIFYLVAGNLIFPQVKYEDFCPMASQPAPATQEACTAAEGVWNPVPVSDLSQPKAPQGYCDMTTKCQKPYEDASQKRQMEIFVLMVGFGVLSIIVGVLPLGSSIVSTGLSYGGVVALIIGAAQYWSEAGNWLKLGIAGLALAALIYIGIRRFRD